MSTGGDLFGASCNKGEVVFREGDHGNTMYIIQAGTVEISQIRNGKRTVLALLEKGDFFGEMALIDRHLRSATATAITQCRLLPFTRTSIMERIRQDPGVVRHLLSTLWHRITQTNHRLHAMVQSNESLRSFVESKGEILPGSEDAADSEHSPIAEAVPHVSGAPRPSASQESPQRTVDLSIAREDCLMIEGGKPVFRQGDPGDSMFIIAEGGVEISQGPENDRNTLAQLGPGDFFGETKSPLRNSIKSLRII